MNTRLQNPDTLTLRWAIQAGRHPCIVAPYCNLCIIVFYKRQVACLLEEGFLLWKKGGQLTAYDFRW